MKKLILLLFFPLILGCEARNNIDNIYQDIKKEFPLKSKQEKEFRNLEFAKESFFLDLK